MQTAAAAFAPPPQNGYQPLSEAEIYAIKRQYLELLPPQQIIDVCLTFEAHAPLHIKSSVWPYDIRAAISSIQARKAQTAEARTSSESDTLPKTLAPESSSNENATASSSQQSTPILTQARPSTSTPSVSQPVASQSQTTPGTAGSHYPQQPYYHPAYPHAPYYTAPHAPYGYPHPYPSYPSPHPMYLVNPLGHQPPLFTNTPLAHTPHPTSEGPPSLNSIDDLPSYEEMIVEALIDSGDPEGCAPKSLFSWMAMHYPLQTNFRPSASQALQKAYKRGRLEKGSNGKYRLNENWEGGNTSRRTTRRPQTLVQTALPGPQPPSSSPFTHAPLISHGATSTPTRLPPPGQPPGYGYPYGYPYQDSSRSASVPAVRDSSKTTSQKQASSTNDHETGEGSDAWEAAQNILKAINYGQQLFQIVSEEEKAGEAPTSGNSPDQQAAAGRSDNASLALGPMILDDTAGVRRSTELNAEQRAALQAQLALLAAQLAELADVSEDELSQNLGVSQKSVTVSGALMLPVQGEVSRLDDGSDNDREDTAEILVPTASPTV